MHTQPGPYCLQSPAQNSQANRKQLWASVILDCNDMSEKTRNAHWTEMLRDTSVSLFHRKSQGMWSTAPALVNISHGQTGPRDLTGSFHGLYEICIYCNSVDWREWNAAVNLKTQWESAPSLHLIPKEPSLSPQQIKPPNPNSLPQT